MANWWEKYKKNTGYPTSNPAGGQEQSGGNWWEEYKRETNFPEGNTQKQATAAQGNPAQPKAVLPGIVKPSQIRNGVLTESSDGGRNAVRVVPNVPNVQTAQPEQPKTEYEARMEGRQYEQTHQTDAKYYTDKIDYAISQGAYKSAIDWMEKMTRAPLTDESRQQAQDYINTLYENKGRWGEAMKTEVDIATDKIIYAYDRGADMFAELMTSDEGHELADVIEKEYGIKYDVAAMKDPTDYVNALMNKTDAGAFWTFVNGQKGYLNQNAFTDFEQRAFTEMEKAGKAESSSAQMDSYIRAQMAYSLLDKLYNYMDVGGNTAGLNIKGTTAQYMIRQLRYYGVDLTAANETNYRDLIRKAMQEQGDKARIMGNVLTNEGYDIDAVRQYMEYQFDVMYEQDRTESANKWAKNASGWDKAAATLASYAEHTWLSGYSTMGTYAKLLGYAKNDDDPNKFVPVAGSVSNADLIQSAVGQNLGETGAFLYGVGNSMIESFLRNASAGAFNPMLAGWGMNVSEVPKGLIQTLTLSQMGVSVAGSTANQILQRGGNSTQAIIGGLASGAIEAITEVASLEVLLEKITKAKGFFGWLEGVGLGALAEGSEEGASNILNLIVDAANMGNLSEQSQAIQKLLNEGKTLEEAQAIVLNENIISLAADVAAGALSGGGEGVIAGGANVAFNKGAEIYYNMKNKDGSYKHIRYFTEQQQKNADEAAKAYIGYTFRYYFGDRTALQTAGLTEKEAEAAAKEYERIQKEYLQITGEKVGAQNGSEEASAEEGTAAGQGTQMQRAVPAVDSMSFTPETAKEDAQSVMELHRQMEQSGQLQDRNRAAQLLKTAEDAMMNVQNAESLEQLSVQDAYDNELALRKVINDTREILNDSDKSDTIKTPAQMTAPENNIGGIENGRAEGLNDSTERNAGLGADQQGAAVQRSAEKATERGRNASIEVRRAVAAGEYDRASAKSLGIKGGSERESMQLLRESVVERIDALHTIRDEAAQDGVKAVFFTGDCEVYNKYANKTERIEGIYVPDSNTVYVKADKINRSAAQIYSHETMHNMMRDNPGMLDYALQLLREQYTPEELDRLVDQYCEAYHGIYGTITEDMTEDERREVYMKYVEEICADAYAGIRRGGINTVKAEQAMETFRTDSGKQNAAATARTNGPGEQRYSVEDDTAYLSIAEKYRDGTATEAETAQLRKMVDEAAKAEMPNTKVVDSNGSLQKVFHGTNSREEKSRWNSNTKSFDTEYRQFYVFKKTYEEQNGHFFSGDIDNAGSYGSTVYSCFLNITNPLVIDCKGSGYQTIAYNGDVKDTYEWAAWAKKNGYNGVIFQNVSDGAGFSELKNVTTDYVAFYSNQIKSADLVTYDDNGNIIPLSERFNPEKKDIRYSVEDDAAEYDEDYRRAVQKDAAEDEPTEKGRSFLPQRDSALGTDYAAVATEEIERRARDASLQQLRNMVKATDKELNYYRRLKREGRASAEDMQKMQTVEETAKIQNEELKHKNAEERKQREKRQEEEAKQQQPRIAKKELKAKLAESFHVAPGQRAITNDLIEQATNKILQRGYLDAEDKRSLFNALLRSGVVNIEPEGYYGEIRSYVQQGRIFVSESVREEFGDDWNEFRKRAWDNRIYLTSDTSDRGIDDWNADLASMFPGGFEEGTTDMKLALEQIVALAEEGKAENITIAEMMERNKDNYDWTVESQMEQLEERFDKALRRFAETAKLEVRIKQTRATDVLWERKRHREMLEQARERKRLSEFQDQTLRKIQKLWKIRDKTSPFFREMSYEVLRDIDTKARSLSERGIEDLIYFESKYEEAKESPNFIKNPYVEERISRLYKIQLDNLSLTDLVELNDIVSGILESIRTSNEMLSERFQAKRKEIATMARKELEATKGSKDGFIHKFAAIEHLEPRRFFEYIFGYVKDGAGAKIAQMMEDGGINQIQYLKGGFGIFEKFTTDKDNSKWLAKASGKNAEWIEVEIPDLKATKSDLSEVPTRKIEITPMMRVALYMHSLNYANQRHAYDGGITIPNKEYYIKGDMENAVAKGITMPISPEIIRAITAGMTEQERQFAKLLQQYFDKYSKEKINEVSLKVDGYERANVNQYFPIKTNKDYLGKKMDKVQKAVSVENYGALKERQTNAKTTIILEDASVTLADHLENMSNYYGFAIPIRDLNAVLSYCFYDEKGNLEDSVIGILKNKWGASAEKYIDKLLKDLQGNHVTNDLIGKIFSYIRSSLAGAQLKLNPSVAFAQFASYPAATQTLGELALLEGLNPAKRADINLIGKYTPLLWYRMQGNSTIELGDYNKDKPLEKKFPLLMNWIQGVDTLTIKRLWIASEYYVKNNTDLRPGSEADIEAGTDEFYQKVAEMFNRAVFDTQPNYSTMQRAQILRSNNELVKSVTMFMTVPIKYYNMMFEASGQLINAQRRGDKAEIREAGKYFFRTTIGLVTATLLYDFFKSFWKGIKHHGKDWLDEEGNYDIWLYIKDTFGHDFIETVAGSMVGGSEAFDLAEYLIKKIRKEDTTKYYGAEVNVLQWGNNIAKHAGTIVDGIANGDAKKIASGIKSLVITGSMGAFSIPAQNAETYAISILRLFSPETAERYENLFSDRTKSSLSEESGRYLGAAISVYMDNRTEDLPDEVKQELQRLWEAGQKNAIPSAVPTSMKIDGEEVALTADQKAQFREVWSRIVSDNLEALIGTEYYQDADETTQGKMIDRLYEYANEMAKQSIDTDYKQETWARIADARNLPEYLTYYTMRNTLASEADEATNTAAVSAIMDYVIGGLSEDDCAEIARLYMNGADGIIPDIAEDKIKYTDGNGEEKTIELDAAARNKYNEVFRDTIGNQLSALMNSPEYASAEKDRDREALINSLIDFARDTAKKEATGLSVDDWVADGLQDMEDGISLSDYVIFRHGKNQLDSKNENGEEENGLAKKKALDLIASNDQWSTAQKVSIFTDYCKETDANIANAMLRKNFEWEQIQPVIAPPGNHITEKTLALMALSVPDSQKLEILEVFCNEDKMNLYRTGNRFGVSFADYAEVKQNADADERGGVTQEEAKRYIMSMALTQQESAYLWQMVTDGKNGTNNPFNKEFGAEFYYEMHKDD